jgi:signal transduction histidine kinase
MSRTAVQALQTTKHSGMGIGSYESFQYIRKNWAAAITVDSQLGRGTIVTVLLPLFEAQRVRPATPSSS